MAPAQCVAVQRVFPFGKGKSEGNRGMKDLVSTTPHYWCSALVSRTLTHGW